MSATEEQKEEIIRAAVKVRMAQKEYFKLRKHGDSRTRLLVSMQLEAELDALLVKCGYMEPPHG